MGKKSALSNPTVRFIRPILDATGLPWEAKVGSSHHKIFLCGRMITVVSRGVNKMNDREEQNLRATLRRAIADAKNRRDNQSSGS